MIKTENLTYSYENGTEVLHHLNLEIKKGSFTAVLGHNGCGKSTLAKHFNAILLPCGGCVYVAGMDTKDEDKLLEIRKAAGMVFQNPDNQIVSAIVEDEVAFAPENLGVEPKEIRRRVDKALETVKMQEFRHASPSSLSGGQKQRIAIASVLSMNPECIVLDEPTAMLDPSGRAEVLSTIKMLNRERHITVILITHYMDEAAQADRVVVMQKGTVVEDDTPEQVFSRVEEMRALGLDVPQVTELFYHLKNAGIRVPENIITVEEATRFLLPLLKDDEQA